MRLVGPRDRSARLVAGLALLAFALIAGQILWFGSPELERLRGGFLPVVEGAVSEMTKPELLGALFRSDALGAYTRALEDELREEHGG